jgi:hypothetical protein
VGERCTLTVVEDAMEPLRFIKPDIAYDKYMYLQIRDDYEWLMVGAWEGIT